MYYLLYLLAVSVLLVAGMTIQTATPPAPSFYIMISCIHNFFDVPTLAFLLISCILVLLPTKSWKAFLDALRFMTGKRTYTNAQCGACLLSLKVTFVTAFLSGAIFFLMQLIHSISRMDLSAAMIPALVSDIGVSLLALLYPLILALFLLPVFMALRREQRQTLR